MVIETEIRAGNPDLEGLCVALADSWTELQLIQRKSGAEPISQRVAP